jgi:hypothetical protein
MLAPTPFDRVHSTDLMSNLAVLDTYSITILGENTSRKVWQQSGSVNMHYIRLVQDHPALATEAPWPSNTV